MDKKYEFTSDEIVIDDVKLQRIKSLRDFGDVRAGELGGYIEKEGNLSHDGNAWVYGDARVYGNAWVYGDARVSGDACVYGNARVYGDARVSGDARVYGIARVSGIACMYGGDHKVSPLQIQGTKHFFTVSSKKRISIGCKTKSLKKWLRVYKKVGRKNNYTDEQIDEYYQYLLLACYRLGVKPQVCER